MFPGDIVGDIANAENRVQNPEMSRSDLCTTSPFSAPQHFVASSLHTSDVQYVAEKRLIDPAHK